MQEDEKNDEKNDEEYGSADMTDEQMKITMKKMKFQSKGRTDLNV